MLKNVKWEQSGINRDVKPPIGDGKGFVAPSATPYRQILELDLPEDFSGKDALVATQKGMDACYSGANELPGILSSIGRGMTLKDNASYAGLMKLFDATNQTIGRSSLAASIYQQRGYVPTDSEIQTYLGENQGNLAFEPGGPYITNPYGTFSPATERRFFDRS